MIFPNAYFFNGTAYAGKSTLVKRLAEKYGGVECGENYHDALTAGLDRREFPCLTYLRDIRDWRVSSAARRTNTRPGWTERPGNVKSWSCASCRS